MNAIPIRTSPFDSGNWSAVNGLPGQNDIIRYLEHLLSQTPNKCFTRRDLMDAVAKEFQIPTPAQEATGPESNTTGFYTRLTYLITDAVQGRRRADGNPFAKRLSLSIYQHISGNGVISPELRKPKKVSKRKVEQARVSVRLLKNLAKPFEPERIMLELGGQIWSDDEVERAIELEFGMAV